MKRDNAEEKIQELNHLKATKIDRVTTVTVEEEVRVSLNMINIKVSCTT